MLTYIQYLKMRLGLFARDERGLALTEYLILLGLLTAGVIVAVLAIGGQLNTAWSGWSTWFETNTGTIDGPGTTTGTGG